MGSPAHSTWCELGLAVCSGIHPALNFPDIGAVALEEKFFIFLAMVPTLGIAAQLVAWWTRLPSILLLLTFGVVLGQFINIDEVLLHVAGLENAHDGDSAHLLLPIVSLSVAVILFEGGLSLRVSELKTAGMPVFRLVSIGAAVSWVLSGFAAYWIMDIDWRLAALLGAILVVTGPTVVAPLMRYIRPNRKIGSIVKWEGIVIDPIGAILAVLVYERLFQPHVFGSSLGSLAATVAIGVGFGCMAGLLLIVLIKNYWVPDYLHGFVFLASAIGVFAVSNLLRDESGLMTVTVLGIFLANQKSISIDHVIEFKENLGVFLISCLFIVLGSRLDLGELANVGLAGALFLAVMIFIVRPASVMTALIGTETTWKERWFLSFLAPRGIVAAAVASVFALEVSASSTVDASKLVPICFLIIVGSVAVYGLGAAPLARRLGLADSNRQGVLLAGADTWIRHLGKTIQQLGFSVVLVDTNYRNIAAAKMDGLRAHCASILSDHVHEDADLSGIGRLLALTGNDEVNALASREYSHLFGRQHVYQLAPNDSGSGRRASLSEQHQGRQLFGESWNEQKINRLFHSGYQIKSTGLTEEFGFDDFLNRYESVNVLLVVAPPRNLLISTTEKPLVPEPGQTIIALVGPPRENSEEADTDA